MQLHLLSEVHLDGTGRVYRQGRFTGTLMALVLGGVLVAAPIVWWRVGAPWPVWAICAALALLIVPMLVGDLIAKFRGDNWLLWLRSDALWINFRSYQDRGPTGVPCVVRLEYAEIACARKFVDRFTTPSSEGGSTHYTLRSLDLELTHDATAELAAAMRDDRRRPPPQRFYFGVGVTTRPTIFPVSLPAADCVRLAWRGSHGHWVAPSLDDALRELAFHAPVAEPVRQDRADWRELSDAELDDQILSLVQSGAKLDAMKLLTVRRRYTTTEAKQFVDGLVATV